MAAAFPYTHYACPCSDLAAAAPSSGAGKRASVILPYAEAGDELQQTFNPHDPLAGYSLHPLDTLLFCDECHGIRCPRCWTEEVINWYCPACLFDVPSSAVKSDGNRCSRNCYNCPSCTAPLAITTVPHPPDDFLKPTTVAEEAYMLSCQYCCWSSVEIGVQFNKPTKITEQLAKHQKARASAARDTGRSEGGAGALPDHHELFASLTSFYKEQLNESSDAPNPFSSSPYSSPANLARIMSLYGGLSVNALKKSRERPQLMREARQASEGLSTYTPEEKEDIDDDNDALIRKLQNVCWEDTTADVQRLSAPINNDARFVDQLWPVATPLRTRKGKRCKTCRQFLARPDPKVSSVKYKIRLMAHSHIPRLSIKPLRPPVAGPLENPAFRLRPDGPVQTDLQPLAAQQYVLTVWNPIFETVKITLATPAITPGKVQSRVTILCPSFTVGPAGDVWDEALSSSATSASVNDGSRKAAMASLTGRTADEADRQPEAGKIWDRTRNSTSVIVEIVPGQLKPPPSIVPKTAEELAAEELDEDDDVLEVPVYLRAEWEAVVDDESSEKLHLEKTAGEKVQRELAYWCVLGVGRIAD